MATATKQTRTYEEMMNLFERSHQESEKSRQEIEKYRIDFEKSRQEYLEQHKITEEMMRQTDRQIKELSTQIGGLHRKHGSFNEALFLPSIIKILEDTYSCNAIAPRYKFRNNGDSFEADLIGMNEEYCYIVEIKSKLNDDAIKQLQSIIDRYRKFGKSYTQQKVVGIIAAMDYSDELLRIVHKSGFLFISISDDIAKLKSPIEFNPTVW